MYDGKTFVHPLTGYRQCTRCKIISEGNRKFGDLFYLWMNCLGSLSAFFICMPCTKLGATLA
jgi:hypothetical protein